MVDISPPDEKIKLLWRTEWWDGIKAGVCEYKGERLYFKTCSDWREYDIRPDSYGDYDITGIDPTEYDYNSSDDEDDDLDLVFEEVKKMGYDLKNLQCGDKLESRGWTMEKCKSPHNNNEYVVSLFIHRVFELLRLSGDDMAYFEDCHSGKTKWSLKPRNFPQGERLLLFINDDMTLQ